MGKKWWWRRNCASEKDNCQSSVLVKVGGKWMKVKWLALEFIKCVGCLFSYWAHDIVFLYDSQVPMLWVPDFLFSKDLLFLSFFSFLQKISCCFYHKVLLDSCLPSRKKFWFLFVCLFWCCFVFRWWILFWKCWVWDVYRTFSLKHPVGSCWCGWWLGLNIQLWGSFA